MYEQLKQICFQVCHLQHYFSLQNRNSHDISFDLQLICLTVVLVVTVTGVEYDHTNFGSGFHIMVIRLTRIHFFQGVGPVNEWKKNLPKTPKQGPECGFHLILNISGEFKSFDDTTKWRSVIKDDVQCTCHLIFFILSTPISYCNCMGLQQTMLETLSCDQEQFW